MRFKKEILFFLILIIGVCVFGIFAQEPQGSDNLIDTLKTQIEKATIEVDKKQQQEKTETELLREKTKQEAKKKQINDFYRIANAYVRHKNYLEAIGIYEQLLPLDPNAKPEIEKRIDFCMAKARLLKEEVKQETDKRRESARIEFARTLAENKERKEKQEKEKGELLKTTQINQYLSLGNEYLLNEDYNLAIEEFKRVLNLEPAHKQAISQLAKARRLLKSPQGQGTSQDTALTGEGDFELYNQLIQEGFQEALKFLEVNDYAKAQGEFAKILENVNKLNLESSQLKIAKQIKEGAKRAPEEILSYLRNDKYDEAKKKLWELIQKTAALAKDRQDRQTQERNQLFIDGYLKTASEYLDKGEYENAKIELQKVISLEPANQEADALLERLEDIIAITKEEK